MTAFSNRPGHRPAGCSALSGQSSTPWLVGLRNTLHRLDYFAYSAVIGWSICILDCDWLTFVIEIFSEMQMNIFQFFLTLSGLSAFFLYRNGGGLNSETLVAYIIYAINLVANYMFTPIQFGLGYACAVSLLDMMFQGIKNYRILERYLYLCILVVRINRKKMFRISTTVLPMTLLTVHSFLSTLFLYCF